MLTFKDGVRVNCDELWGALNRSMVWWDILSA